MYQEGNKKIESTLVTEEDVSADDSYLTEQESPYSNEITQKDPGSWMYYALGLTLVLIVFDYGVSTIGRDVYWSARSAYFISFVVRFVALMIGAYLAHTQIFYGDFKRMYIVFGWVGGISGLYLASVRFTVTPAFWTFMNMIVEPIDSILLALLSCYIVRYIRIHKTLTKKTL